VERARAEGVVDRALDMGRRVVVVVVVVDVGLCAELGIAAIK
jgi:hypothetical protein